MKKRSWRRCGCLAALLFLVAAALWIMNRPYPQLRKAIVAKLYEKVYDRRRVALTLVDVENLVKAPPGDYSSGFRKWDNGNTGGASGATLFLEGNFSGTWIDPARSPVEMAKLQSRMSSGRLYGWWARNRVLIVEVDENSIVQALSYSYCENCPKGWLSGLVWQIDKWIEERD